MTRIMFVLTLFAGIVPQSVIAGSIQLIQGLPSTYTPGELVFFDIDLPPIANLGSYNIDVVLESDAGSAGVDFYFDIVATLPAATQYVFPSAANFFAAVTSDSPTRHRITLTDFDFAGVKVVPGVNYRVATVAFRTLSTFSSPLSMYVDAPLLILDTPDIVPTPVLGFVELQQSIAAAEPFNLAAVPEPANVFLLLSSAMGVAWMRRRFISQVSSTCHIRSDIWTNSVDESLR